MDTKQIKERIASLEQGEFQSEQFFVDAYGLTQKGLQSIENSIVTWSDRQGIQKYRRGSLKSRWTFERYYAAFDLLSPRAAACRMGIALESLRQVLSYAERTLGAPKQTLGIPGATVPAGFVKTLFQYFPSLQSTTFSSHSTYCRALHRALASAHVKITPVYDVASQILNKNNPDVARYFDIVTLEPIGSRYNVSIGAGKPISLEPDRVSVITYVKFEDLLAPLVPSYRSIDGQMLEQVRQGLKYG